MIVTYCQLCIFFVLSREYKALPNLPTKQYHSITKNHIIDPVESLPLSQTILRSVNPVKMQFTQAVQILLLSLAGAAIAGPTPFDLAARQLVSLIYAYVSSLPQELTFSPELPWPCYRLLRCGMHTSWRRSVLSRTRSRRRLPSG